MFVLDQYGNKVEVPVNTGEASPDLGLQFAAIEGTVVTQHITGDRTGSFRVISDGTTLFTSNSYYKAIDYCDSVGLAFADCTR